jgi:hypothetical protein
MLRGVPPSFKQSMKSMNANCQVWLDSYTKEYCTLCDHGTFTMITFEEYQTKYSHISIIPTMNVQTVKKEEDGLPMQAKSRIVVLGNLGTPSGPIAKCMPPLSKRKVTAS